MQPASRPLLPADTVSHSQEPGSLWVRFLPEGRRGKVNSVVSLEATRLRQYLSGTEKGSFRKHRKYFAHMDDNKAT